MVSADPDPPSPAAPEDEEGAVVMGLDEAVRLALTYQQDGHATNAEALWRQILAAKPDEGRANHFLGLLLYQRGARAEAQPFLERSRRLCPDDPHMAVNFGLIAMQSGDPDEALRAFDKALSVDATLADAHANRGIVLRARGKLQEAEAAYRQALGVAPKHGPALSNLADLLLASGRESEALLLANRAAEALRHGRDASLRLVGTALTRLGRLDEARAHYHRWLAADPGNPFAEHALGALSETPPERCSDSYVRELFDEAADSFNDRLASLGYSAPAQIDAVLTQLERDGLIRTDGLAILDAGCGTGLCGPLLKPRSATLTGIDLSDGMLSRAAAASLYDRLVNADIVAFLTAHPSAYDLIVAADVLIYFGALEDLFGAAAHTLRPGGLLVATCESAPDAKTFLLSHSGRYAHHRAYVEDALERCGLDAALVQPLVLRKEHGADVDGWVFAATRAR